MTDQGPSPEKIDPFVMPGGEKTPLRPLCPWETVDHDDYLVAAFDSPGTRIRQALLHEGVENKNPRVRHAPRTIHLWEPFRLPS